MSEIDVSWLIGGGFICLAGVYLGNSLQSFGAKLVAPQSSFAFIVASSPNFVSNWAVTKLVDLSLCCALWWLISWALAFGKGNGSLMIGTSQFSLVGIRIDSGGYALCFYTFALMTISAGILSDAVAHYCSSNTQVVYRTLSAIYCLVVFPFIFHWSWSDHGWASPFRSSDKASLLAGCGVIDSAGSSVIHMTAGVAAAAILTCVDTSRLHSDKEKLDDTVTWLQIARQSSPASNIGALLQLLGTLFVWSGSYGFHAINNLPLASAGALAGKRVGLTTVGAACACVTAFAAISFKTRGKYTANDALLIGRCALTGLAAMGACCGSCEYEGALTIGVVAAILNIHCDKLLKMLHIDDSSGAICIHILGGVWGMFAAGLLTSQQGYKDAIGKDVYNDGASRSTYCKGVFYGGRGNQLGANIAFILATLSWSYLIMLAGAVPLKVLFPAEFQADQALAKTIAESAPSSKANSVENPGKIDSAVAADTKLSPSTGVIASVVQNKVLPPIMTTPTKLGAAVSMISSIQKIASSATVAELEVYDDKEDDESFEMLHGYSWDVAIVFHAPEVDGQPLVELTYIKNKQHTALNKKTGKEFPIKTAAEIITSINSVGLQTRCFLSEDMKKIICKIRAPLRVLKASADLSNVMLPLEESALKTAAESGWSGMQDGKKVIIQPMFISYGKEEHITSYTPYQYIYSAFDDVYSEDQGGDSAASEYSWPAIYALAPGLKHGVKHGFGANQRLKLIRDILTSKGGKGCNLDLRDLLDKNEQILGCFALHDDDKVEHLRSAWLGWDVMPWSSPCDDIREYFGEKIALYFTFLGHYCTSLIVISVLGLGVVTHLIVAAVQNVSVFAAFRFMYSIPVYCFCITLWAAWMLETWQFKEKCVSLQWGMIGFEATEHERKEYNGKEINSWINGKANTKIFDRLQKQERYRLSSTLLTTIACVVVGVFSATFFLKFWLKSHSLTEYSAFADVINALTIQILNFFYKKFAVYMSDFENHKTDTQYEDSIILKLFIFGFFNSYCPSIYIAFIKQWIGDKCTENSCMGELAQTMMIIFVTRLLSGTMTKIVIPQLQEWIHRMSENRKLLAAENDEVVGNETVRTATEEEFMRKNYDEVFDDYNELSVQFGYICLFAPAFPLAPLLAFASNFCEIRADGYKVLKIRRRAWPHGAEDIGTWQQIFQVISILSVFSNAGLIFYTMDIFDFMPNIQRLGVFFTYIIGMLFLRQCFGRLIEEYPEEVDIQLARQEVLVNKVIKRLPDEDEGQDLENLRKHGAKVKTRVGILPSDPLEQAQKIKLLKSILEGKKKAASCVVS